MARIFIPQRQMTIHIQPGNDHKDVVAWRDSEGAAILFSIHFKAGMAETTEELAKYMVDRNLASRSPIAVPV